MRKYQIKYETYDGNVKTVEITSYDEYSARQSLINCREVYWIRKL